MKSFFIKISKAPIWLMFVIVFLVGVRLTLPYVCKSYLNRYLASDLENYVGSIKDFDLSLYRGAYQIEGLEINKRVNPKVPFVKIKAIDLSLAWRALWHRRILLDATVYGPQVNLVDSKKKDEKQYGKDEELGNWDRIGALLIPTEVESFNVQDGSLTFSNNSLDIPMLFELTKLNVMLKNIKNMDKDKEKLPSSIAGSAIFQGHAPLSVKGKFNVMRKHPDLDLDVSLRNFRLKSLNKLLMTYVPLSIDKGTLGLVSEVKAMNGNLSGYFKPFVQNVDVVDTEEDFKSLKHFGIEMGIAAGNLILRNSKDESVITVFELHGTTQHPRIGAPKWFAFAWKNAFGEPLPKGFE